MKDESALVLISIWKIIQIYFYSIIFGSWLFLKSALRWMWNYNVATDNKLRDNPPGVLIDTDYGRHSYFKIKGMKLHYVEAGSRGMPPVVLLHGFPDCWVGWKHQLEILSSTHHVWALDLLGCGDSDKPKGRIHYTPRRLLTKLRLILETIAQKPPYRTATIIAHDLGGLLAWYMAHEYPELIDKLIIVSSPHPNVFWDCLPSTGVFNMNWMWTAQIPYLPEYESMKGDISLLDRCYPHLSKSKTHTETAHLDAYKFVFSRTQDWTGPINYYRNLIFWRVKEERGKVRMPVLLIVGNKDSQVSLESIILSSDRCNQVTLKIVEGAGHYPHQEAPKHFNSLLQDFLISDKVIDVNHKSSLSGLMSVGMAKGLVGKVFNSVHLFT